MVNKAVGIPENPDKETLRDYLEALAPYADSLSFNSHEPDERNYWKAVDMVQVALHLSGVRVWATESHTGGISLSRERSLALRYLGWQSQQTVHTLQYFRTHARVSFAAGRLLVGVSDRIEDHIKPATHPSSMYGELTATSMHLSDIDSASRSVINEVFGLPEDFDTELMYQGLAENVYDTIDGWRANDPVPEPPVSPQGAPIIKLNLLGLTLNNT